MDQIYTMEQWSKDRSFAAAIGQEVDEEVYEQMYNCLPPLRLPRASTTNGYFTGFRVGEPYTHAQSKLTGEFTAFYAAFGKRDGKYYYLGNMNKYGEIFDK